ncbi:MAG: NERD domain-containing protein, partial [Bacillaceae bacterium]|nr:NERD domain-containing protein [Bacillaceae bacterium]
MIKKTRTVPVKILKLQALLRRLPRQHPKRRLVEEELAKSLAGYYGEKSIDYYLSFLPQEYLILHDLRLPDSEKRYFQIDTLILSPKFFIILEVKNISGTLIFDQTFHQLIRQTSEKEEGFPDPILQVKRQQAQFQSWLTQHKFPRVPIIKFIVISNPATIIKQGPVDIVIHAASIPQKLKSVEEKYRQEIMPPKTLKKLSTLLVKQHQTADPDILERLCIAKEDVLTGVHCPRCEELSMIRKGHGWICPHCHYHSIDAFLLSLDDYALLFAKTITNQELRNFLQIPSTSVASKLLASLDLKYTGEK